MDQYSITWVHWLKHNWKNMEFIEVKAKSFTTILISPTISMELYNKKLEKHTKTFNSLHFTAQIRANGSKTPTLNSFHICYDYSSRLSIHFHVMNPYHSAWFVNYCMLTFASHSSICVAKQTYEKRTLEHTSVWNLRSPGSHL